MNRATRRHGRRDPASVREDIGITVACREGHYGGRIREWSAVFNRVLRQQLDRLRHLVIAAGIRPNVGLAQRAGLTVERAIVVDDHMRSIDDATSTSSVSALSTAARCTGWWRLCGSRPTVLADHITDTDRTAAYHGSRTATKLKVAGVDVAAMGLKAPELPMTSSSSTPSPGTACTRPSSSETAS